MFGKRKLKSYMMEYFITGADHNFNGVRYTRFSARNGKEVREFMEDYANELKENFPSNQFPNFDLHYCAVWEETPLQFWQKK